MTFQPPQVQMRETKIQYEKIWSCKKCQKEIHRGWDEPSRFTSCPHCGDNALWHLLLRAGASGLAVTLGLGLSRWIAKYFFA
jgi:predicted RNA-binding Zn-ribbon protein involved in translation (DUF1610 family)